MPSDLRAESTGVAAADQTPLIEPPSVKLIVRLFVIPFLIVGAAVGVMFLISLLAGQAPSVEESINGLKSPGGNRTANLLIGPGAKQRYLYAKTLTDHMKAGMSDAERVKLTSDLIDIIKNHTQSNEGEVQHFLLLALGRAWQIDPTKSESAESASDVTASAIDSAAETLLQFAKTGELASRKAAILSMAYFRGRDRQVAAFLPVLESTVRDEKEDLDVRLAAATVLGPLGKATDTDALDALRFAMRDTDPRNAELVWASALSLAQHNQPDVAETILKLLSREELANVQVYDREADPKNPSFRKLSEAEQERILINTMLGVEHYDVPAVKAQLEKLSNSDPSQRVRAALKSKAARDMTSESR